MMASPRPCSSRDEPLGSTCNLRIVPFEATEATPPPRLSSSGHPRFLSIPVMQSRERFSLRRPRHPIRPTDRSYVFSAMARFEASRSRCRPHRSKTESVRPGPGGRYAAEISLYGREISLCHTDIEPRPMSGSSSIGRRFDALDILPALDQIQDR